MRWRFVGFTPPAKIPTVQIKGNTRRTVMKKLVAVAALGAALAAFPVSVAMKPTGVTAGSDQALAQEDRATRGKR
jgi:hypothetical protein